MNKRIDPTNYDPRKHNYFKALEAHLEKHRLTAGQLEEIDVCHDDWCGIYRGRYCKCERRYGGEWGRSGIEDGQAPTQ